MQQFLTLCNPILAKWHSFAHSAMPKAVKPGGDVNENGRCVSLRTTNPFTLWRRTYARNHVVPVRQHNQQRAFPLSKNNTNHSPNYLIETNIFKFLLEHLFWFTWQRSRLSWTCGCYTHPDRTSNELVWKIVELIIWDWNVSSVVLIRGFYSVWQFKTSVSIF